jgi:hypothetical protein
MMRKFSKKFTVIAASTAFLVVGGGVAFAFWTAGGSGTGTAATGTSADITVLQTSTVTAMGPGVTAQSLSGNFTNTTAGPVYVTTVTASIASVFQGGVVAVGCSAADYTLTTPAMAVGAEVPVGTGVGAWSGATIAFNNTTVNQDACKGATVNLAYAAS